MIIVPILKNDAVYNRVKTMFSQYEVLRNVSHYQDLIRTVLAEEVEIVIIDESLHWKKMAMEYLSEKSVNYVTFNGNFNTLNTAVLNALEFQVYEYAQVEVAQDEVIEDEKEPEYQIPAFLKKREEENIRPNEPKKQPSVPQPEPKPEPKVPVAPKIIERVVEKRVEVPVERIVEKRVEVDRFVDREVIKTKIHEVKPDLDSIDIDLSLPTLPTPERQIIIRESDQHNQVTIGLMAVEEALDTSEACFLIANAISALGYKVLVVHTSNQLAEAIKALEELAFENEKEDNESNLFVHEDVHYLRSGQKWSYADILNSDFSHVIYWYEPVTSEVGFHLIDDWNRCSYPILLSNGAKWKADELTDLLSQIDENLLHRSQLLLQQQHPEVVKKLNEYIPDLPYSQLPSCIDPFVPDSATKQWASEMFIIKRKRSFPIRTVLFSAAAMLVSAACVWVGLEIDILMKVGK